MDAVSVLSGVFGFREFRGGQRAAVEAVLEGKDAVVLLPTGAGKSLCYQVPAVALARRGLGTTIVVSPLIALMIDQVAGLTARGIAAAALHSHQDDDEQRAVIDQLLRGQLAVLYVSPERAVKESFQRLLRRTRIALFAIDEAHCVSEWGHDFRPEYMQLRALRDVVDVPTIALTATATPRVLAEIAASLHLRAPATVRGDFRRPNLAFEVQHLRGDEARFAATIEALEGAGLRATGGGRAIVYCATRKKTEAVAERLKQAGFAAAHYHAGRTALARDRAQRGFSSSRTRVLVATSAFGMGVDYPDVRVIVHFQAPGSLEAYYQEAGRASRDGAAGRCVLLFGAADLVTQRRLAERGGTGARREDALASIERYASAARCRQQLLCAHFTGTDDHPACGTCDACVDPAAVRTRRIEARETPTPARATLSSSQQQLILDAVAALRRPIGKLNLAKALRGSTCKAMHAHGLLHLPQHGALRDTGEAELVAQIEQLIAEKRLARRGRKYPTVSLPGPRSARRGDPVRSRGFIKTSNITIELETYRKRMARQLRWKAYMVFQRGVIAAIDRARPTTHEALARIPGLGPAKIARFGDDILALVRRHAP
ncbi:MAG: ATP-dependent DNA helicase RecQ [Myxococcales bacterium]|nr:ATP-dependent DNA helicase RecQ [Myxococcales bacterium]